MPALLFGIASGALTVAAWFLAERTIEAGVQGVQETGKAINGPTLQLAGVAAVLYAGALILREAHLRRR